LVKVLPYFQEESTMTNILVTGGFGFLGSHLVEFLLKNDSPDTYVHVVDDLSTSPLPLEDLLDELGHPDRLTYSITTVESFCQKQPDNHYDEIYHLASVVGPAGVLPHAGRIAVGMLNDTLAIANLALATGARLLDVSTSEVYGGGQEGFCSEAMPKIISTKVSARLEYAVGKLAAEVALLNLCAVRDLDVRIVRPFNISGPRQSGRGGFVLPRFMGQAMTNRDITVFGDGQQVRAFTHVEDIVIGLVQAMRSGKKGEVYNIGNPENRCRIIELAEEVRMITESKSAIVFVDPKSIYGPLYEEANDKYPDASKAMSELGWKCLRGRKDTIEDTFRYMGALPERLLVHLCGF
jgi:UDP-glucose 4-epimerase